MLSNGISILNVKDTSVLDDVFSMIIENSLLREIVVTITRRNHCFVDCEKCVLWNHKLSIQGQCPIAFIGEGDIRKGAKKLVQKVITHRLEEEKMGVNESYFLFVGIKTSYQSVYDSSFEKYTFGYWENLEKWEYPIAVVSDSMSGKYTYWGKIIAKSNDYFSLGDISLEGMKKMYEKYFSEVSQNLKKLFPDHLMHKNPIDVYLFCHYS